ncbi:hypothetical protein [Actinokineospora fastidiosa]|uniref:Uncharacterized protein n=1 Tax=Actinokineospora fastidiosa TaxID=1816 RepID=A0A918GTM9_9PSEU|nr:hypothetical protein [Actinokineospora fastidiosa]GGS59782.1 hypothetical protein GCM10010171_63450 [Actinokineospora fastidiosa]
MEPQQFATLRLRGADGMTVHGPYADRADADMATGRFASDITTFACTLALYPPDADPITTCATTAPTGTVLEMTDDVADALLTANESDPGTDRAGPVAVAVLVDPPARRLLLWIGPFPDTTAAQSWLKQASTVSGGTYRATMRVHPLHATDVAEPEVGPKTTGTVA